MKMLILLSLILLGNFAEANENPTCPNFSGRYRAVYAYGETFDVIIDQKSGDCSQASVKWCRVVDPDFMRGCWDVQGPDAFFYGAGINQTVCYDGIDCNNKYSVTGQFTDGKLIRTSRYIFDTNDWSDVQTYSKVSDHVIEITGGDARYPGGKGMKAEFHQCRKASYDYHCREYR